VTRVGGEDAGSESCVSVFRTSQHHVVGGPDAHEARYLPIVIVFRKSQRPVTQVDIDPSVTRLSDSAKVFHANTHWLRGLRTSFESTPTAAN
jgi:predicted membrane-bound spermidine synthase